MTGHELAARLGVRPATVVDLEASEARGSISLKTLAKAASALNCRLVYALVPENGSLETLLHAQAGRVAERMVSDVSHSMNLEAQGVDKSFREQEIKDLTEEFVRTLPRHLWKPLA
jgi:XRE family transcriptional regulator, regulator of sulfur utilization